MRTCVQCEECRINNHVQICLENCKTLEIFCTSFWARDLIYILKDKQIQRINVQLYSYFESQGWINIGKSTQEALTFLFTCEHKEHYFSYLGKYIKTCGTNIPCGTNISGFCKSICPSTEFQIPWPSVIRNFEEKISTDRNLCLEEFIC